METRNGGRSVRFREGGRTYLRNRKYVRAAPAAPGRRLTPPAPPTDEDHNDQDITSGASGDSNHGNDTGDKDGPRSAPPAPGNAGGSLQPQPGRPHRTKHVPVRLGL